MGNTRRVPKTVRERPCVLGDKMSGSRWPPQRGNSEHSLEEVLRLRQAKPERCVDSGQEVKVGKGLLLFTGSASGSSVPLS